MPNMNAELAAALKALTDKVEQIDKRTSAIATAPNRYYLDAPEAAPVSAPPPSRSSKRKPARPIADQILDLVQDEPRSGAELIDLIGSPRSSVNQAIHLLEEQRKVYVIRQPPGRGATLFVFPRSYKDAPAWVLAKLGYEGVRG
jgi:hypothetical protein